MGFLYLVIPQKGLNYNFLNLIIMDIREFIENFAAQFDETEASVFTPKTVFHDLDEWSSLTALGIIAFVKTEYNKTISGREVRSCETIQDLFELVNEK